ncbi:hypothetical protein FHL15_001677 [Xylaria flabelliformis]|uniref:NACHT domain-containing protein n=1 Tax=Xylaria flabelliformis TaxID=2512241 RepID=A0A553IB24_9PEZI|nr:hypothetical protein FHL15_001677 [Xylaria flabelliformis]
MDPVSAFNLASSIVTFVDFAAKLVSATAVILRSKEGASTENLGIENVYAKLEDLSTHLGNSTCSQQSSASSQLGDVLALQELSVACKQDCRELINALQALKVRGKKFRVWRSVKAAFKAELGRQKVAAIEGRLERTQKVISLHVSSILSHQISQLSKTVESMSNGRTSVGQASVIESMSRDLENLKIESKSIDAAKPQSTFSVDQIQLLVDLLSSLTKAEERLQADTVIASLNYDCRPVRHSVIPRAHKNTFRWAFDDSHLSNWLSSGTGVFWVSGKAGSGKSTFMKFLADHSQTRKLLERWADSTDLVIAAHYFWSAGTTMQKSQQGLLQSLLFDIFRNCPKSIPIVCPIRWGDARHDKSLSSSKPWTADELSNTLRALAVAENISHKFCFFIDGLDEYEDDHIELCNVLRDASWSSNIKICLSSRPWVVFEDSFGVDNMKKLYMHDLTRDDIEVFAREQLQTHPRWAVTYTEIGEREKHDLIEQVAERAEGVFLWAFLVTRSLREGLSNDDTIADMWRRLESLPKDLQRLFKHMLDSVDAIYYPKMAGALQVAIHAFEPIQADIYWHLEKELEEQDYAIKCPMSIPSAAQSSRRREQIRRRINARTKGLLETRNDRVEFLHRTVRDFLLTAEMSDYLANKLNSDFNVYTFITKSYLALLKTTSYVNPRYPSIIRQEPGQNGGLFIGHLNQALLYAAEALKTTTPDFKNVIKIIDEYERSVVKMVENSHISIGGVLGSCDPRVVFREEVVKHQLFPYIRRKVQEEPEYFCILQDSPLFAALTPMTLASGESPFPAPEMLEFLLKRENNRNAASTEANKSDIYLSLAFFMHKYRLTAASNRPSRLWLVLEKGIFDLLLSHDADPDALVYGMYRDHTVFCDFFISILRAESAHFEVSLCNLDAFLRAQPSLSSIPVMRHDLSISDAIGRSANQLLGAKLIATPLAYIIQFLQDKSYWPSSFEQLEFWCKALERLIRYALDQHQDLTPLVTALRESDLPNHEQPVARLLNLIEGSDHDLITFKRTRDSLSEEIDEGKSVAYQRGENREEASQCSKRQKRIDKPEE